jgi:hypothetical protein
MEASFAGDHPPTVTSKIFLSLNTTSNLTISASSKTSVSTHWIPQASSDPPIVNPFKMNGPPSARVIDLNISNIQQLPNRIQDMIKKFFVENRGLLLPYYQEANISRIRKSISYF